MYIPHHINIFGCQSRLWKNINKVRWAVPPKNTTRVKISVKHMKLFNEKNKILNLKKIHSKTLSDTLFLKIILITIVMVIIKQVMF